MIQENYRQIAADVRELALHSGREAESVRLLAVTKTVTPEMVDEALAAGAYLIGENKVQEAERKLPLLTNPHEFHFIGHLQTNKAKALLKLRPALIHSVDRLSLALVLEELLAKEDRTQDILLEVNASGEVSKSGVAIDETKRLLDAVEALPHLRVRGLMTIGPLTDDPTAVRDCFRQMKRLYDELATTRSFDTLSMGMSHDYPLAIAEGSTLVRIGTAIFGARPLKTEKP